MTDYSVLVETLRYATTQGTDGASAEALMSRSLVAIESQRERIERLEGALREIATVPCTNTIAKCKAPFICVTCIARAALEAKS